tara:strand:- start:47 stop:769 length:723 start_codon:yes stop_codon:yes gene_type:complete
MNKSYYTKFSVGLIDSLLIKSQEHTDYLVPLTSGSGATKTGKDVPENYLVRPEKTGNDFEWMMGSSMVEKNQTWKKLSTDETVHNWLIKSEMKPVLEDIDYDYEYKSPFDGTISKALLLLKWIIGLQVITKDTVSITREDLAKIGYDHLSPLQLKINFDKIFGKTDGLQYNSTKLNGCLTKNHYNEDTKTWDVKIGPREVIVDNGPGSVRIKTTQYNGLLDTIMQHHQEVLEETKKQPAV